MVGSTEMCRMNLKDTSNGCGGVELLVLALRAPNYKVMIQLAGDTDGCRRQQHKIETAHLDPSNGKHVRANAQEEEEKKKKKKRRSN